MGAPMRLSDRIGCRLKLQDLHVLMTVAQAGSMGKAAERLRSTQPNVSRSIAELERAVGARLLDRSREGVELTHSGHALLNYGNAAFDSLSQGVKTVQFLADPTAGEVRIGCNPFLAAGFVAAVIDKVLRAYPGIACHLVIEEAQTLHRALADRKLDFLVTRKWEPLANDRLAFEYLFDDSFVVVAGDASPWARRRRIALCELVDEQWVLPPPDTGFGTVTRESFRRSGHDYPRTRIVATAPEVRLSLLATGRYLTIFPTSALEFPSRMRGVRVLPVKLPMGRVANGIITLKDRMLSPVAQLFIERARETAKESG
jgi:DNA-binding transcriptional LysR family regulator